MRTDEEIQLSPEDRVRLEKLVAARMTPQKHVWRAQIVLLSADGMGTAQIMRRTGRSKPTVWRWQARFATEGVDGLLRDKTRPPGKKPLAASVIRQVVTKTTTEKPPAPACRSWCDVRHAEIGIAGAGHHVDPQRLADPQGHAQLARRLACLEIDDEPDAGAG